MTRLAGAAGPIAFVVAWVVGGARTPGYSPIDDAISRIAEVGAPARPLMTVGFVAFGVAVPAYAVAARDRLGLPAATSLAVAGLATLGVAAFPLEEGVDDTAHGAFAALGYAGMAAAPLLVRGRRPVDTAAGALAAASLLATALGPWHGLFQRLGLTVVDAWIVRRALRAGPGQARQRRVVPVPASSTEPGMTRRRWGSRRSTENDGDSGESQPGIIDGS